MHKQNNHPIAEQSTDSSRGHLLAKAHDYLMNMKATLLHDVESELRRQQEDHQGDCMDSYDIASQEHRSNVTSMLSERDRVKLGQIDAALKRIGEVRYGWCETCGLEISEERLLAILFTRLCRDCQHALERAAKAHGRQDGQDFQDFGSSLVEEAQNDYNLMRKTPYESNN